MQSFDLIVIGGGPGGYVAAIKAAQAGKNVALVEKEAVGGVCLNWGCIPTKAMLKSAKVYQTIKNAKSYGFTLDQDSLKVDFPSIIKRKNRAVKKLTGGVGYLLKKNGVTVFDGFASVKDANTVEVNDETLEAKNLIIATGASPAVPPIDGLKQQLDAGNVLTSKEILDIKSLPKSLTVIGGGVIGVEFATIFNALGSEVTILERESDILLEVDEELKAIFKKKLQKDGVKILTNAAVSKIEKGRVTYTYNEESETIDTESILLAAGMRPNLKGLENLELSMSKTGIETDEYCRTSVDGVYAIGDVNGKYMLAHVASKEGVVAVEHMFAHARPMDYNRVPSGIYTFPEIAQVGLTESAAKAQGLDIKVATFPMSANGKALAEGESDGLVKLIALKEHNIIIGAHILAPSATEMIAEAVLGMTLETTADDIVEAIHPHPTLSEMMHEVAHGIVDKPIHI